MEKTTARRFLHVVEIGMVIYTGAAAAAGYLLAGRAAMYAIALGGCIMYINLLVVMWLVARMLRLAEGRGRYPVLSGVKSFILLAALSLLVYEQREVGLYTLIGLANIFFAVLFAALLVALWPAAPPVRGVNAEPGKK